MKDISALHSPSIPSSSVDYSQLPSLLEQKFHHHDLDDTEDNITSTTCTIHPTILSVHRKWKKVSRKSILAPFVTQSLDSTDQLHATRDAFRLLDCLTKSGSTQIIDCQLHLMLTLTHSFPDTMMNSLIRWNLNPIEEMEKSFVIFNSFIQTSGRDRIQPHYQSNEEEESEEADGWEMVTQDPQMRQRIMQSYSLGRTTEGEGRLSEKRKMLPLGKYFESCSRRKLAEREEREE
jgi:hypothetical protein